MSTTTKSRPLLSLERLKDFFPVPALSDDRIPVARLVAVTAQLALLVAVIHLYKIEEDFGLLHLTPLILGGFIAHALLPLRYRPAFFVLLSLAGIVAVLGLKQGAGLIALGFVLIGICHLPVAFAMRVTLVALVAGLLAAVRAGWIETGWSLLPKLVLPLLGAMFMFRLVIYLYDLRHEKTPATIWERLGYFFMLPNVCFLLFPVVDYQTFRRTYYSAEAADVYQKGVLWVFRGVMHLLLYRVVYHHLLPSPTDVTDLGGVVQYMLTTYLLYLRISGQFHLIAGIMCLFGFNLPETHHLYYLASSFSDYWRRINIYWKDFMMKIFYYPSFMRLRRWGMTTALVTSTFVVFLGTWLLHSYQWFWLQGTFLFTAPDALFWGILGALVVTNSLYEASRGRKRSLKKEGFRLRAALTLSLKTVGMFAFITVLWSLWSSPSITEWGSLVAQAANSNAAAFGLLFLIAGLLVTAGVLIQYMTSRGWSLTLVGSQPSFSRSAAATGMGALVLLVLAQPQVHRLSGETTSRWLASVQDDQLNEQDVTRLERGYYEGLLGADKYTSALLQGRAEEPDDWEANQAGLTRAVQHLLTYELVPSHRGIFLRAAYQSNRWGMRDKEYEMEPAPGTYRIAMLGSSYEMGAGVENDQIYEARVEARLNEVHGRNQDARYEILNFAVTGYSLVQNVVVAREKAFQFGPDALFLMGHSREKQRITAHLVRVVHSDVPILYPGLREILSRSGVKPDMSDSEIERRLKPYLDEVIRWGYQEIASVCVQYGIEPVWIYVPRTYETSKVSQDPAVAQLFQTANEAGFTVLSLEEAYGDRSRQELAVAAWDSHPSVSGHQLLADRLYQLLAENEHVLKLGLTTPEHPAPDMTSAVR